MKKALIIHFIIIAFAGPLFSQSTCTDVKVISPVVAKPREGAVLSVTCSALQVQWKGTSGQSYSASAAWFNTTTNKWDTAYAAGFSCDAALNCKATIPVPGGSSVNWNVQATQIVSGRTFYSYYLIGDRAFAVPACTPMVTKADVKERVTTTEPVAVSDKLLVYPNPASSEITVQWSGGYTGPAVVAISDAAGKEVKVLRIAKEAAVYTNRIPVGNLVAGLYYVQVRTQSGQALSEKFFKQ